MCAGVLVRPQDVMVGDADGVVAIPREVEEQVVALAIEKVTAENNTREALRSGETLASVFQRFGIL